MSVIHLQDITFVRGERKILDRVTWSIERGRHWALLGANGSGKTTLLKIITGYEWPTEGSVQVLGYQYGDCNLPQLRKAFGWVSSALEHDVPEFDCALDIVTSGFEASLGLYRDFSESEIETAHRTLALLGGSEFFRQPYHKLSQGEQQRVLIARALVNKPHLLILDEPCSGLDPAARESFLTDLGQLIGHPDAPTIIYVTHHIEEIAPWVRQVMILKDGKSLTTGNTQDTLTAPWLSDAFGHACHVDRHNSRYYLRMDAGTDH
jgi:iron complex transport system ATP-binding protein